MAGTGKQLQHHQAMARQDQHSFALSLILHDVDSPDNVGGLFRLADALGIQHIYLSGSTPTPPNKRLRRAARQTEDWIPHSSHSEPEQLSQFLAQRQNTLIALEITEHSVPLDRFCTALAAEDADRAAHYCLILGSESSGVDPFWLSQCNAAIHIPMQGNNSSMNIVAAASIACYQLCQKLQPIAGTGGTRQA